LMLWRRCMMAFLKSSRWSLLCPKSGSYLALPRHCIHFPSIIAPSDAIVLRDIMLEILCLWRKDFIRKKNYWMNDSGNCSKRLMADGIEISSHISAFLVFMLISILDIYN
jgi:hypothetical protein